MIRELRDRHVHGEVDRVAPAGHELVGAERRLDPGPAAAAVLLALVADDAERSLHHVDLVGLLELVGHRLEVAAARRARLVRLIELVDDLDDRKHFLLARAVTATGLLAFVGLVLGARSPLGGVTEERLRAARELLLQVRDLELEALGLVAACFAQLAQPVAPGDGTAARSPAPARALPGAAARCPSPSPGSATLRLVEERCQNLRGGRRRGEP